MTGHITNARGQKEIGFWRRELFLPPAGPIVAGQESIEIRFQAAVAEILDALQLPTKVVNRELAAVQPISFAAASNRRVIGSMNEFARQIESDLTRIRDPLHLSLRLAETPMSAVGSKACYGLPGEVARDLVMSWEH